ncbi:MAG: hypothetical protein MSA07_00520 [Mucispirillum sp.]|nr:hypothetical protein [Mucispirillum sp.]
MINILDKVMKLSQYIVALLFTVYLCVYYNANHEPKINYIIILLTNITAISAFNILVFKNIENISPLLNLIIYAGSQLISSMTIIMIDIISDKAINNASFIWTGQINMWDKFSIIFMLIAIIITMIVILKSKTINDKC